MAVTQAIIAAIVGQFGHPRGVAGSGVGNDLRQARARYS